MGKEGGRKRLLGANFLAPPSLALKRKRGEEEEREKGGLLS